MRQVIVYLRNGKIVRFEHEARPGGSYRLKVEYLPGWLKVTDVWDNTTAFPSEEVITVETKQ